jgi:hypothetical protein
VKNPDFLSGLVIMTHRHTNFECLSPRDYVDTKSWLGYEQNPYSTHWVRSGSCHREASLGYDILPAITQLRANMNIWLLHTTTTLRCKTLPQPIQPWVVSPSLVWLGSTISSMTRHLHRTVGKSPWQRHHQHHSIAPSTSWLGIYITPWSSCLDSAIANKTQKHHC